MHRDPIEPRRGVLIADDHILVRAGVRALLEDSARYRLAGEAGDVASCLRLVESLRPDVLLLDIMMPDMSGIDAVPLARARSPGIRILFLSSQDSRDSVTRAMRSGADGFLSKDFAISELERAMDAACAGGRYLSQRIADLLVRAASEPPAEAPGSGVLTSRQVEVLRGIAQGLSNKQIARELTISPKTVEFHRGQLMQRLDMHDVASLTRFAVQAGYV